MAQDHRGGDPEDKGVWRDRGPPGHAGIHQSMVDRLFGLAQRLRIHPDVVNGGGVSKNIGIVRTMEAKLARPVLVPEDPQIVGALGAALVAQQGLS
jgi:activator of 2-hydroxyglutaryl-CoA dehydratase